MAADKPHREWPNHDVTIGKWPQVKVLRFPFANTNTVETDSGVELPSRAIVFDVWVEVVSEVASGEIDVGTTGSGTNGNADGFIDGLSTAAAGVIAQAGSNATTYGAFLAATDQSGSKIRLNKLIPTADESTVTYTTTNHASTGFVYIAYVDLSNIKTR